MCCPLILILLAFTWGCSVTMPSASSDPPLTQLPTAAPVDTESAGKLADAARKGVVRVICRPTSFGGTGFLHRSGAIITAAHVVAGCASADLVLLTASGQQLGVTSVVADSVKDLALLRPSNSVAGSPLPIAVSSGPGLGAQVTTWGYPGGYDGLIPLLSVGYFAGVQDFQTAQDGTIRRWVINAAFNGGNSGGPVFAVEDGRVIGVVSSKLAPLPPFIASILGALEAQKSGFTYNTTAPDGSMVSFSEGQLIGTVLQYLRSQVQLVVGYAVTTEDVNAFLKAQDIAP
jgi:S1-C subfamily serine protease